MTDEDRIADLEADLIKANNQIAELKEHKNEVIQLLHEEIARLEEKLRQYE